MTDKYSPMRCPLCHKWMCAGAIDDGGCEMCSGDCWKQHSSYHESCTCGIENYVNAINHFIPDVAELEDLRIRLAMLEQYIESSPGNILMKHKIRHILRGGWKNGPQRFLQHKRGGRDA